MNEFSLKKTFTLIINSSGSVPKGSLYVDIPLCITSWKLVEDVLTTPIFLEWFTVKRSWRRLEGVLKTSWNVLKMTSRYIKKDQFLFSGTSWRRLENILKTSWRYLENVLKMQGCNNSQVCMYLGQLLSSLFKSQAIFIFNFLYILLYAKLHLI